MFAASILLPERQKTVKTAPSASVYPFPSSVDTLGQTAVRPSSLPVTSKNGIISL
jgi:hypothetical protein